MLQHIHQKDQIGAARLNIANITDRLSAIRFLSVRPIGRIDADGRDGAISQQMLGEHRRSRTDVQNAAVRNAPKKRVERQLLGTIIPVFAYCAPEQLLLFNVHALLRSTPLSWTEISLVSIKASLTKAEGRDNLQTMGEAHNIERLTPQQPPFGYCGGLGNG